MYRNIIINWQGPYEYNDRGQSSHKERIFFKGGLYLFTGIAKHSKKDKIQYVGIAQGTKNGNSYFERFKRHKIIPLINRNFKVWLGNIDYPKSKSRIYLEETEKILIYFTQAGENTNKKNSPPEPLTVINQWYKPNKTKWSTEPRFNKQKTLDELDDVLCWDGEYWRTASKLIVYEDY